MFFKKIIILPFMFVMMLGCTDNKSNVGSDAGAIQNIIRRYNTLVIEGYRNQNMNPLQEVTTEEHARKLYHHMSALGEGKLRMESKLKKIIFKKADQRSSTEVTVETEETWDFAHFKMENNEKYAEEQDFIYRIGYILQKKEERWIITQVNTISGTSTNTVIPWPQLDRKGNKINLPQDSGKPVTHP